MSNWLDDDDAGNNRSRNRWDDDDCEDFDPNKDYYAQKLQRKEHNMLESTERSLRLLEESERVGNAAAVELDRQGEVLRRTEQKVDKMEQDLKQSDRHLRSIKSIWGAFMNKFSKEPPPAASNQAVSSSADIKSESGLTETNSASIQRTIEPSRSSFRRESTLAQSSTSTSREAGSISNSSTMSAIDDNLDLMGNSLSRLKSLSLGLKDELDAQDPILGRLAGKVERVDDKMHKTNKEMMKIYHS